MPDHLTKDDDGYLPHVHGNPPSFADIVCVRAVLRSRKKGSLVRAVKLYRFYTGCSMAYAKERVEEIMKGM
jgi:ribosomal protein L7/L12